MRILFLSRRSPPIRLGYVTENELTERDWENAVQGLGKFATSNTRCIVKISEFSIESLKQQKNCLTFFPLLVLGSCSDHNLIDKTVSLHNIHCTCTFQNGGSPSRIARHREMPDSLSLW